MEQLVDDAKAEYFPDKQLEHTLEEAAEKKPTAQAPVTALSADVAQYDPPGHDEQLEELALAW